MRVTIQPGSLRGTVAAPPSKSMAHRMLICAALAEGESLVRPIEGSEDILATADCLRALGAEIREDADGLPRGVAGFAVGVFGLAIVEKLCAGADEVSGDGAVPEAGAGGSHGGAKGATTPSSGK